MAGLKTKANDAPVSRYLDKAAANAEVRADCDAIVAMMEKATKAKARMWGDSIVGFGSFIYRYENGKEIDWMLCGFSPRKANISLYVFGMFPGRDDLLEKMGKHSCGAGCLYIKRLSDIHVPTLRKLINESVKYTKKRGSADREETKAKGREKRKAAKAAAKR
jgi:hypothetical protein